MLFKKHINRKLDRKISSWRKVAIASWKAPRDPSTFGLLKFEADAMMAYIQKFREQKGQRLTPTHIVGKALGLTIKENSEINGYVIGNSLYKRDEIDVFFQVALDEEGKDLSGLVIKDADKSSLGDIVDSVQSQADQLRKGKDKNFNKIKKKISKTPNFVLRYFLNFVDFVLYKLNIWSPLLGVQPDPFGTAMVTNVASFGVEMGFVPIPAISHVPLILAVFSVKEEAIVKEGKLAVANMITIGATLDHRVIDGVYGGKIVKSLKKYIENPELIEAI